MDSGTLTVREEWAESVRGRSGSEGVGGDGVTQAHEVRLFSLAHQVEVKGLLAEGAFGQSAGLQIQTHSSPRLHQVICRRGHQSEAFSDAVCSRYKFSTHCV